MALIKNIFLLNKMESKLISCCLLLILTACRNEATNDQTEKDRPGMEHAAVQPSVLNYDSTTTGIIPWNYNYLFDRLTYKPTTLTEIDIKEIERLLLKTIEDYNNSLKDEDYKIDLEATEYKKQLVAVVNSKREKEVWVNCFCRNGGDTWKTEIVVVFDGGPCYFNFKVNLSTKKVYDLMVNGMA